MILSIDVLNSGLRSRSLSKESVANAAPWFNDEKSKEDEETSWQRERQESPKKVDSGE